MLGIVEIEIDTIDLILELVNADIKLLDMAKSKKWERGTTYYQKRITMIFSRLEKIGGMIDNVAKNTSIEIEDYKRTCAHEGSSMSMRMQFNQVTTTLKTKLEKLKNLNFEKEMRVCGFKEFDDPTERLVKTVRRRGDGTREESDLGF
jgi:hypothetical protein